jgi:peptide/nickel transport system substrate-binding protein
VLRQVRWQITLIVVGIVVLAGLMGYLALSFTTQLVPAPGGTYIEGVVGQPQFLNPLLCAFNDADRDVCSLVFNGLVKFNARGEPQPDLAQSWSVSDGDSDYGRIYTFNLRTDVQWQDGQPFTADDVIFTINLLSDPNFPGRPDIAALWRSVEAVKVNNAVVQITLPEPYAPFLDYAAIGILPAHSLNRVTADQLLTHPFNQKPIGTGPFQVEAFTNEPGRPPRVLLAANPRYYGRQPFINKIEFKYYATMADVFTAYRSGEVQGIASISPADFEQVRATPSLDLFTALRSGVTMVMLNTDDPNSPFFKEVEVRKALLLALDRQAIIDTALEGQGIVADSPFPPNSWAYDPDTPHISQQVETARQLLEDADWISPSPPRDDDDQIPKTETALADPIRLKNGVPLSFTLLAPVEQVDMARIIASQWRRIGVSAQVQPVQVGLASNFLQARQYQAALANFVMDTPDPDPYPFWHETKAASGQNYSQFKDRDISEVLEAARRVVDRERRAELYYRFVQMFHEKVPSILLYYPVYNYAVNERVRDVQLGPMLTPADRFQTLADWHVIERRVIVNSGQLAP